jgi:hypothetical protein
MRQIDPAWADKLQDLAEADPRPAVKQQLADVLLALQAANTPAADSSVSQSNGANLGRRYRVATCRIISIGAESPDAPVVLCAADMVDEKTGARFNKALLRIAADGACSVSALPDYWDISWIDPARDAFRDSKGRFWLNCGARIETDGQLSWPLPRGFTFRYVLAEDDKGRFYFRAPHGIDVLDESLPEPAATQP